MLLAICVCSKNKTKRNQNDHCLCVCIAISQTSQKGGKRLLHYWRRNPLTSPRPPRCQTSRQKNRQKSQIKGHPRLRSKVLVKFQSHPKFQPRAKFQPLAKVQTRANFLERRAKFPKCTFPRPYRSLCRRRLCLALNPPTLR